MPRSKKLPELTKKEIIVAHKRGDGYKTISKNLGLHISTVRQVVYRWRSSKTTASLPRSGSTRKIMDRIARQLVADATRNPRVISRELQSNLQQFGVHVHRSTIRRTLNTSGLYGRVARKKPLLKKKHNLAILNFAKAHIDKPCILVRVS
jgi:transposase